MSYMIRLFCRALIGEPTWQSRRRYKPVQAINCGNTAKRMALSESEVKQLIEGFPKAKVIRVIDGDTVIVAKGWNQAMIRLDSIDCPEDGQHWGDTAAYGLIKLIGGRKVHLEEHGLDCHGRTLATIYVQHPNGEKWVNVNERMVTLGHAWVMRKFYDHLPKGRQDKLNRLESWARSKYVGLWRTQSVIPPWQWRWRNGREV
jgi:micrococcal nuclease